MLPLRFDVNHGDRGRSQVNHSIMMKFQKKNASICRRFNAVVRLALQTHTQIDPDLDRVTTPVCMPKDASAWSRSGHICILFEHRYRIAMINLPKTRSLIKWKSCYHCMLIACHDT
ncbi:unnamed protein product [Leptosia nina]|uniref:Uncharacterized protein n=1 Tax=Leptosia nina TaxID=320188 RepID=A0AAV1J2U6_9NEOP